MVKKEKLSAINADLKRYLVSNEGFVKNIGKVFFTMGMGACVLRDIVYRKIIEHGFEFEVLCLGGQYFVGSKEHAEALKDAFGG